MLNGEEQHIIPVREDEKRGDVPPLLSEQNLKPPQYNRYAIYYAPEADSALAQFGRSWFGYDAEDQNWQGERRHYGLGQSTLEEITNAPRHYGFHATLKAPFRLHPDRSFEELDQQIKRFTQARAAIALEGLALTQLGRFLALCPTGDLTKLNHFAAQCVSSFDAFRAPLTQAERTRRLAGGQLNKYHRLLLENWGYPYVMDAYQFHITLTRALSPREMSCIAPILTPAVRDYGEAPFSINSICLFAEPENGGSFELIQRYPLNG